MKTLKFVIILNLVLGGLFAQTAVAEELSPEAFLLKISKRLTEKWPLPQEYEDLNEQMRKKNCNKVSCLDGYFRKVIQNKMKQDEFYALFYSKVTERWGYKTPASIQLEKLFKPEVNIQSITARRDFSLVYYILRNNLSFDQLYTSQFIIEPQAGNNLELSYSSSDIKYSPIDLAGFRNGESVPTKDFNYSIQRTGKEFEGTIFDLTGHNNVSGLFSSAVYWNRYWNTSLNNERKRAAHFYKVMLCDPMSPALDRETEKQRELRMAQGVFDEDVIKKDLQAIHRNKHGSQKDCASCHTRLDPVGYSFRAIENGVSNYPVKGVLKVPTAEGLQAIETNSFHDLTTKTTKLAKYFDCQMNWLVESYLGKDLKIPTMHLVQVGKEIEAKGRKTKDVIETLLMLPEFRGEGVQEEEIPSLTKAKAVFANCAGCHGSFLSLRPELLKKKVERISVCLDLRHDGADAQMPPMESAWFPTEQEVKNIRTWVEQGAPLSSDYKMFTPQEVDKVINYEQGTKKCRE